MSIPTTKREYFLPKFGSYDYLSVHTKKVVPPKRNEVLVKVHAVSLQYRDLMFATSNYPVEAPKNVVPCSDMAGEIVAVGPDVKDWSIGNRVCANFMTDFLDGICLPKVQETVLGGPTHGVLTEYRTFPDYSLVAVPGHLSYEEASTLPCAGVTAYNALFGSVSVKPGEYVLIQGTGGVSIFGLQFAVAAGAVVIVTSSSDAKLKTAVKLGAKHVINYNTTPKWDEEVLKITEGLGVDHVVEVGGQGTLIRSINASKIEGHIHIVGFVSKDSENKEIINPMVLRGVTLRAVQVGSLAKFVEMNRLLSAHPETARPIVNKVFPFDQAKAAYEYLASQAHVGKVVIKVSKD